MINKIVPQRGHHLRLSPTDASVGIARRFARRTLEECGRSTAVDDVTLVVSELVTNAVGAVSGRVSEAHDPAAPVTTAAAEENHDGHGYLPCEAPSAGVSWVVLSLYVGWGTVVVEVWDQSQARPTLRTVDENSESGRGLAIVSAVGSAWGTRRPETGGKIVWCEIGC